MRKEVPGILMDCLLLECPRGATRKLVSFRELQPTGRVSSSSSSSHQILLLLSHLLLLFITVLKRLKAQLPILENPQES